MEYKYILRFDGGAYPNPGPSIGAYVIYELKDGIKNIKREGGVYLDEIGTNNNGEYLGLIEGLKKAIELDIKFLNVESDAMLVISQMNKKCKVTDKNLIELYNYVSSGHPWPLGKYDNVRSYCSIINLCFVLKELSEREDILSGVYNVADNEMMSTNELVLLISNFKKIKSRK